MVNKDIQYKNKHRTIPCIVSHPCWVWYHQPEPLAQQGISLVLEVVLVDMRTLQECCCSHETQPHRYMKPSYYQSTVWDEHGPVYNDIGIIQCLTRLNTFASHSIRVNWHSRVMNFVYNRKWWKTRQWSDKHVFGPVPPLRNSSCNSDAGARCQLHFGKWRSMPPVITTVYATDNMVSPDGEACIPLFHIICRMSYVL